MEPFEKQIRIKHSYTETEKVNMAEKCSALDHEAKEKQKELEELIAKQKADRAEIELKIADKRASISEIFEKLYNGFEERPTKCMVHLNYPMDGKKTIYNLESVENENEDGSPNLDNCESWVEDMTDADLHLFPTENQIPDPHREGWYLENYGFDPNAVEPKLKDFFLVDSPISLKNHGLNKKLYKEYEACLMICGTGGQYSQVLDNAPEEIKFRCSLDVEDSEEKWFVFDPLSKTNKDEESE